MAKYCGGGFIFVRVPVDEPEKPTPPKFIVRLKFDPFPVKQPLDQTPPPVTVVVLLPENIRPSIFPEHALSLSDAMAFPNARGVGG